MSVAREKVAEALYRATYGNDAVPFEETWEHRKRMCRTRADASIAAHLEWLAASGHVVVKLPEPVLSPRHRERIWEVGDSHVVFSEKWLDIRAELDYDGGDDDPLSVADARAFAAALLAAVDAAEASDE